MSEEDTGGSIRRTHRRRAPVRDADGYHYSGHHYGDGCPGGHLSDVELEPHDKWYPRTDDSRRTYLDDLEEYVQRTRGEETFYVERFLHSEPVSKDSYQHSRSRRVERHLRDAEEDWDSDSDFYDPT